VKALDLMTIIEHATNVFGSAQAARYWLVTPAIALDRRRPLDVLHEPAGVAAVATLLTRIDFCVYT
jgi:putative toxin-antitoxin system antitoxin component (TIGR02293 family)